LFKQNIDKMIIIAESGSTKTDWVVLKHGNIVTTTATGGYNPNYFPPSILESSAAELSTSIDASEVKQVFFYGSGCSSKQAGAKVRLALGNVFLNAEINVFHDLFGAARALFGSGSGIASILGTGSSSCLFLEGEIAGDVPSLGYLLADEGSGWQLGKMLISAYFKNDLPDDLRQLFEEEYKLELGGFIGELYSLEKPNSLISSYAPFVVKHKNHPFLIELVMKSFMSFFEENILKYKNYKIYPLGFVGSIAFLFSNVLEKVASHYGLKIEKIIKGPIDELARFHGGR
jgi:N-acetylglucosamine kinase-like BadF-type ATPase